MLQILLKIDLLKLSKAKNQYIISLKWIMNIPLYYVVVQMEALNLGWKDFIKKVWL